MACIDGTFTAEIVECCTLEIKDGNGDTKYIFDLTETKAIYMGTGEVKIFDNNTWVNLSVADLSNLGYTVDELNQLAADCRCGNQATTSEPEIVCVEENDNLYIACIDNSVIPATIIIKDFSGNDVTGTVTPKKCVGRPPSVTSVDFCIDGNDFTRKDVALLDEDGNILSTSSYWLDINGDVVADPTDGATSITKGVCSIGSLCTCANFICEIGDGSIINNATLLSKAVAANITFQDGSIGGGDGISGIHIGLGEKGSCFSDGSRSTSAKVEIFNWNNGTFGWNPSKVFSNESAAINQNIPPFSIRAETGSQLQFSITVYKCID